MSDTAEYDASNIQVLEGLEAVRKRPGLYVGDVRDGSGLLHTFREVVLNCIDHRLNGQLSTIQVDIDGERICVEDDGPGFPVDRWGSHRAAAAPVRAPVS